MLISILSKCFPCSNESNQKAIRDHSSKVEINVLTASPGSVLFSRSTLLKRKHLSFSCLRLGLIRHRRNKKPHTFFSKFSPRFLWRYFESARPLKKNHPQPTTKGLTTKTSSPMHCPRGRSPEQSLSTNQLRGPRQGFDE